MNYSPWDRPAEPVVLPAFQNLMVAFNMDWYHLISMLAFAICLASCLYHFMRLLKLGKPRDLSASEGNVKSAVLYSFTGGMNPAKKESAYLHLPTYTAGILFHIGTFLSIILFFFFWFDARLPGVIRNSALACLIVSASCGLGILVKRLVKKELKALSNPDDYISNLLVTSFQICTLVYMLYPSKVYFLFASALLIYLPIGKLRHTLFFFAARYHLGFFYGHRGVWPPKH